MRSVPFELTHMGWTLNATALQQRLAAAAAGLGLPSSSASTHPWPPLLLLQQHLRSFTLGAQFLWRQARGLPTGAHAPFKGLMVDAATLRFLRKDGRGLVVGAAGYTGATGNQKRSSKDSIKTADGLRDFGREESLEDLLGFDAALLQLCDVVELLLRSCSVLIERFHHSLFLYMLTGLDSYVSVERYIGPLAALIGMLAVQVRAAAVLCCVWGVSFEGCKKADCGVISKPWLWRGLVSAACRLETGVGPV